MGLFEEIRETIEGPRPGIEVRFWSMIDAYGNPKWSIQTIRPGKKPVTKELDKYAMFDSGSVESVVAKALREAAKEVA